MCLCANIQRKMNEWIYDNKITIFSCYALKIVFREDHGRESRDKSSPFLYPGIFSLFSFFLSGNVFSLRSLSLSLFCSFDSVTLRIAFLFERVRVRKE